MERQESSAIAQYANNFRFVQNFYFIYFIKSSELSSNTPVKFNKFEVRHVIYQGHQNVFEHDEDRSLTALAMTAFAMIASSMTPSSMTAFMTLFEI